MKIEVVVGQAKKKDGTGHETEKEEEECDASSLEINGRRGEEGDRFSSWRERGR